MTYGTWYCPACDKRVTNNALGREAHRRSPSHREAIAQRSRGQFVDPHRNPQPSPVQLAENDITLPNDSETLAEHQQPKVHLHHDIPEVKGGDMDPLLPE